MSLAVLRVQKDELDLHHLAMVLGDFEAVLKLVNRENLSGAVLSSGEDDAQTNRATQRRQRYRLRLDARLVCVIAGTEHADDKNGLPIRNSRRNGRQYKISVRNPNPSPYDPIGAQGRQEWVTAIHG